MIKIIPLLCLVLIAITTSAQVGIGTSDVESSALLQIDSSTDGILIPRMTETQKDAIATPATGLLIFQTDQSPGFQYYNGAAWIALVIDGWEINGNTNINSNTNFLGTIDQEDLVFATNNNERMRISDTGNVGINENNPQTALHITSAGPAIKLVDGAQANGKVLTSDANGTAVWSDAPSTLSATTDQDWLFDTGSNETDPIFRRGGVVIGRSGTTTHELDIDTGVDGTTTLGIGDTETIEDGTNTTFFNAHTIPDVNATLSTSAGNNSGAGSNHRWNTTYSLNNVITGSDRNIKSNITNLSYGINELMLLQPKSYVWKNERYLDRNIPNNYRTPQLGFIAQDLNLIIPEVVHSFDYVTNDENAMETAVKVNSSHLGIRYNELIALLVKSKQDQQERLDQLQTESARLIQTYRNLTNGN
ncbi:MAG: tail fiber domain-containing protein [Nonlabens sp.]|uniref:tail fiber domain-containing protein n=1 Tax=Nonlabens sp. TaxID=1888209 RepID=UPI003EF201E4